jgi:hypothetical protein
MPDRTQPDRLAVTLGHVLVGAVFAWGITRTLKTRKVPGIVAGALAAIAHAALDVPVSQVLSNLGL